MAKDKNYATNQLRVLNRTQLYSMLYNYIHQFNFKELFKHCKEKEIPIGKIRNLKEVFELPEAKEMIRVFWHNKKELKTVSGIAFKFQN